MCTLASISTYDETFTLSDRKGYIVENGKILITSHDQGEDTNGQLSAALITHALHCFTEPSFLGDIFIKEVM